MFGLSSQYWSDVLCEQPFLIGFSLEGVVSPQHLLNPVVYYLVNTEEAQVCVCDRVCYV